MALFLAFSLKKRRFFVLKVEVLSARNSGFRTKKRWFLKFIHIFVGIKNIYHADYQYLLYNTQNKRFCHRRTTRLQISAVCMLRTAFLLILFAFYRRGVIYHVPSVAQGLLREHLRDYLFLEDCGT